MITVGLLLRKYAINSLKGILERINQSDNSDLSSEEQRALDAFTKLDIDDEGNTPYGTRAQTALRYVLSEPKIDNAIVGLAELSHLNQVLEASELGPLPETALEKMIT